jgi:hypothetical protein
MNGGRAHWAIVGLAAVAGSLATLLAVGHLHRSDSRAAYGQTGEAAAEANYVLALLGNTVNDATPIVLVDTKAQTLLVYEYMVSRRIMFLRVARTYAADRELLDNSFWTGDSYAPKGQTVNEIQSLLRSRQ